MKNENKMTIFLADDDAVFLKLLEIEFTALKEYNIETFATGELCLLSLDKKPDIVVLDYHLDGIQKNAMTGIETLDKIRAFDPEIPVIILSSQDKIDVAVNCMHHRAFDYVVKSETAFMRLQKNILSIIEHKKMERELKWYMERM